MPDPVGQPGRISLWREVFPRGARQLELPLEGLPSTRRLRMQAGLREFTTGFAPRLGQKLLMRFGVPMVAATTPVAIGMMLPDKRDDVWFNLAIGSGLGGAWGAMVGGLLPYNGAGDRIGRIKSTGRGAASGIVLAPAVAVVSKYVVDWITEPIRDGESELQVDDDALGNGLRFGPITLGQAARSNGSTGAG